MIEVVTRAQLEMVALPPEPERPVKPPGAGNHHGPVGLDVKARAIAYLRKMEPGIEGQRGSDPTYAAAVAMVYGFDLGIEEGLATLLEFYNPLCQPPWSEEELRHKCEDADRKPHNKERGYLLKQWRPNVPPTRCTATAEPAAASRTWKLETIAFADFLTKEYRLEWLVKRLLVKGQPCILGGAKKVLKTGTLLDLGISLGSGTPFLGEWEVPQRQTVVLLSGESGEYTLQETARRIHLAKLRPVDVSLHIGFDLPTISNHDHVAALAVGLKEKQATVCIIDPLYLCMIGDASGQPIAMGNLFEVGPLLKRINRACQEVGCTLILAAHAKKHMRPSHAPIDLDDLAWAGLAEFARQWILIQRTEAYHPGTGQHHLLLQAGGSVGHGGCWSVDIEEGVTDADFDGRFWEVRVRPVGEAAAEKKASAMAARADRTEEKLRRHEDKLLAALDAIADADGVAAYYEVRTHAGLNNGDMAGAFSRLTSREIVAAVSISVDGGAVGQRKGRGIRRVQNDQ